MASFGWAYVDCSDAGSTGSGSAGPAHSIQFVTESGGATTGSANLTYYTGSVNVGSPGHTLHLTGTFRVKGAISASSYHIENITQIGATGSTNFGNSNDDVHLRTGSFAVANAAGAAILTASAYSQQVFVKGFGGKQGEFLKLQLINQQQVDELSGTFVPSYTAEDYTASDLLLLNNLVPGIDNVYNENTNTIDNTKLQEALNRLELINTGQ